MRAARQASQKNWLSTGTAYLALAQASFAHGDFEETEKWAKPAVQMHLGAPIGRAIMIACCVHKGELKKAREHADFLKSFAPDFISSILDEDLTLYRTPKHNALLIDGLCKAGSTE